MQNTKWFSFNIRKLLNRFSLQTKNMATFIFIMAGSFFENKSMFYNDHLKTLYNNVHMKHTHMQKNDFFQALIENNTSCEKYAA